jgi:hypothetical protein
LRCDPGDAEDLENRARRAERRARPDVWSAAVLQAKDEKAEWSARMYPAFNLDEVMQKLTQTSKD